MLGCDERNTVGKKRVKVVVIQCICPHYRVPFFRKLAEEVDLTLFYGRGERRGSWRSGENIDGFRHKRLFSIVIKFQIRDVQARLVWFPTLLYHLHRNKPDVIISEGFTNIVNNLFTWSYCTFLRLPWIIWDSGRKKEKPMSLLRKILEPLNLFLLRDVCAIIGYSSVSKDYFLSSGIDGEKIFIAQNTIDVKTCLQRAAELRARPDKMEEMKNRFHLHGKRVLLYVGVLEKRKKVEDLIEVYGELEKEFADICLLIIGEGSYREKLMDFAKRKRVKNCLFLGRIIEGVEQYFVLSDIFVLPGRGGLAVNQAMAYGKPVIVGEGDGTEADLVKNNVNGFLIHNTSELKNALVRLLTQKSSIQSMGRASVAMIQKYDLDNMAAQFVEAVEYCLQAKP